MSTALKERQEAFDNHLQDYKLLIQEKKKKEKKEIKKRRMT